MLGYAAKLLFAEIKRETGVHDVDAKEYVYIVLEKVC